MTDLFEPLDNCVEDGYSTSDESVQTKSNKKQKKKKKKKKDITVSRKASRGLSKKHAIHFADNLKIILDNNPKTFCPDHPVALIDHMYAGNDCEQHLKLCPAINATWCQFHTEKTHVTTMAHNKYLNRMDKRDAMSYNIIRARVATRFDEELCVALRGIGTSTNGC